MKKIALLLLLSLALSTACAEGLDFSSMDDAQLHTIIDSARNELAMRELVMSENVVLFEQDGVSVYLTGEYETMEYDSENLYMLLKAVIINDSNAAV